MMFTFGLVLLQRISTMPFGCRISSFIPLGLIVESETFLNAEIVLTVRAEAVAYHSSKVARDRDRLRQAVLEGLNWRIHRVWSTDWYRDPEREFARLIQRIENLQASA
jgi:hypothetical protein